MQHVSRWGAASAPPIPPPRDPTGINSIVEQHRRRSFTGADDEDEDMSSDSSSAPVADHKRRSSYENVRPEDDQSFFPNKPPPAALAARRSRESSLHRSTPSPRPPPQHIRASPSYGSRHTTPVTARQDSWSDVLSDEAASEHVRRRPASACGRAPRSHRGSMPPVECSGSSWGHRSPCTPCCTPVPYHWCGAAQNWPHYMHSGNEIGFECEDLEQKICQLEVEKHHLTLQVNVLTDQVEAQNEKIMELESSLSQNKEQLSNSEILLKQEMSSRSSIESSKLDLMAQISALRLRLANVEIEKKAIEERNNKLENELILTCACLAEKEAELATFKSKLTRNGATTPIFESNSEFERLKGALSSVMAVNDEKEREIQEMRTSLNRYKKLHELVLSNPSRKSNEFLTKKLPSVEENFLSALDSLTSKDLDKIPNLSFDSNLTEKPPPVPRQLQQSLNLLTLSEDFHRPSSSPLFAPIRGESPSPFSTLNSNRYSSSENVNPPTPQKTPPSKRHYSTLPRPHQVDILKQYVKSPDENLSSNISTGRTSQSFHNLHHTSLDATRPTRVKPSSGSSFGKGFFKLRLGKRSSSAPELAPDKIEDFILPSHNGESRRTSSPLPPVQPPKEKSKGFRKIFGKVKRSGSESLNTSAAELKRGGIRATAGPRLGWSEDLKSRHNFKANFSEWDSSMICDWFLCIGLSMYVPDCKRWIKNGEQLLKATTTDFEKELNIKNPLHRKKLLLALKGAKEQTGDIVEPAGKIDHQWVIRWLDDIGLPQYKDAFYDARIDGRMLHHLTLEDLSHLKVINLLHHISIKTGIQVLRENNFDQHCLKRRALPEDDPTDVSRWTNHRVMEWLKTVDLSEYAPNLRGSGVHGGLMMYEHRFNADLMATLLNIPPSKTLLRRHLTTQFKQLIGAEIVQKKREWESQPNYTPLSPSAKVKTLKRSPFSLVKKRNKIEFDEDYVCPLNFSEKVLGSSLLLNGNQNRTEEEKFLMKEMVLKNETILENMPASNV